MPRSNIISWEMMALVTQDDLILVCDWTMLKLLPAKLTNRKAWLHIETAYITVPSDLSRGFAHQSSPSVLWQCLGRKVRLRKVLTLSTLTQAKGHREVHICWITRTLCCRFHVIFKDRKGHELKQINWAAHTVEMRSCFSWFDWCSLQQNHRRQSFCKILSVAVSFWPH